MYAVRREMTKIIKLFSSNCPTDEVVHVSANILKEGKIIAVPTDTVYGITALAQCDTAVKAIYKIKGRDCRKPLAICVGCVEDVTKWGKLTFPKHLLDDLLPGPVTLVMERQSSLNPNLNPGIPLVGIRIPKCKFIQDLASQCDGPLALTSANISSAKSTLAVQEFKDMWPHLDLIVDGGILGLQDPKRLGSTVVDLSQQGFFRVIRSGCSFERTLEVLKRYGLKELG